MFRFEYKDIDFSYKIDRASDPKDNYQRHMHYFNELIYFIDGDVKYTVESDTMQLKKGDLIFISPGKYHFAQVGKEAVYERFVLKFSDSVMPPFLREKMHAANSFFGEHKELQALFTQLDSYYNNFTNEELYSLFVCEIVKTMILLCKTPQDVNRQYNTLLSPILRYIDENIQSPISPDSLSEHFHFSKSYIGNEFKKYIKMPLMQYIRTKKIIAAHNMLLAGRKKTEVAELFGFEDYSTFYRTYLKVMGFPPTAAGKRENIGTGKPEEFSAENDKNK